MEGGTVSRGAGRGAREPPQLPEAESRRAAAGQGWQRPWDKAESSCVTRTQHSMQLAQRPQLPLPRCLASSRATAVGGWAAWHRDQRRKQPPSTRPRSWRHI